jgi:hypothetical protein
MLNGQEVGSIVPSGTFDRAHRLLALTSFPHVKAGDVVSYEINGDKAITSSDHLDHQRRIG